MKVTFAKPHALNGEMLAAGTHDLPDKTAEKLIARGYATKGEKSSRNTLSSAPAAPTAPAK